MASEEAALPAELVVLPSGMKTLEYLTDRYVSIERPLNLIDLDLPVMTGPCGSLPFAPCSPNECALKQIAFTDKVHVTISSVSQPDAASKGPSKGAPGLRQPDAVSTGPGKGSTRLSQPDAVSTGPSKGSPGPPPVVQDSLALSETILGQVKNQTDVSANVANETVQSIPPVSTFTTYA